MLLSLGVAAIFLGNYQRIGHWELVPFLAPFKASHYFVNYFQFGFTKRALVGTVFFVFDRSPEPNSIIVVCLAVAITILVILTALCFVKNCSVPSAVAMSLSPFTFQNIGFDLGRTDHYGLLAVVSIVLLSELQRDGRKHLFYLLSGLSMMACVLSHEVSLLFVPAIALYLFENDRSGSRLV